MTSTRIPLIPDLAFPKTMDNTLVSNFASCPRKAYLGYILHLKPKRKSIHLHAGKAYAAALDAFRTAFYTTSSPAYHNRELAEIAMTREFLTAYGYDPEVESEEDWAKSPKSGSRMLEMLFASLDERPPLTDPIQPLILDGKPAVEKSFTLDLDFNHPDTNDPLLHHGRFDMLADYNGQIFVYDDKTCTSLGPQWIKQWDFRSQFTGYVLGAKSFDLEIAGAIVRGHCILKGSFKFADAITFRKPFQLERWWEDTHGLLHAMIQMYERAKEYPDPLSARAAFPMFGAFNDTCSQYGGCPYKALCESQYPQRWLGEYEVRVWDPVAADDNADVKPCSQQSPVRR